MLFGEVKQPYQTGCETLSIGALCSRWELAGSWGRLFRPVFFPSCETKHYECKGLLKSTLSTAALTLCPRAGVRQEHFFALCLLVQNLHLCRFFWPGAHLENNDVGVTFDLDFCCSLCFVIPLLAGFWFFLPQRGESCC